MNKFLRLLSLVLCFELIVGPYVPRLTLLSVRGILAQETSCPGGTQFDTTLNRCITSEQTASIMNAVSNCAPNDKACYKANAEAALKKAEEENKVTEAVKNKGGMFNKGMKAAAVAVPLLLAGSMLFGGKQSGGGGCKSMAVYMMLGAGAVMFLGDMYANKKHKSKLKKIREEWEGTSKSKKKKDSDTSSTTASTASTTTTTPLSAEDQKAKATEMQSEAFEMLAKSEDSMASTAKFKRGLYGVATLAFGAAAVMSAIEAFKQPSPPCKNPTQTPKGFDGGKLEFVKNTRPENSSLDLRSIYKQQQLITSASDFASLYTLSQDATLAFEKRSSPSLDDYEKNKKLFSGSSIDESPDLIQFAKVIASNMLQELNPIKFAFADADDIVVNGPKVDPVVKDVGPLVPEGGPQIDTSTVAAPGVQQAVGSKVNNFLSSPTTRAVIAGIFAAWSATMAMHANKQAKASTARAKFLRDQKKQFDNATGAISCTTAERGNSNSPSCYCYTPDGKRNTQRANSDVCTKLFTGKSLGGPNDYSNVQGLASQKVCVTTAGVDENCACKSTNTCLSAIPQNFSGVNPGTLSLVSSGLTPLNQLASGGLAAGTVDATSAVSNAGKLLDAANKITSKIPGFDEKRPGTAKAIENALVASSAGLSGPSLGDSSAPNLNMTPAQAAAELEKELKNTNTTDINTASGGTDVAVPNGGGEEKLEFGMTPDQLAADQTALAEVMDQKIDYGQNDINSGSDTNLFEVLSSRYQRSGMRRLFDEDGKSQPDQPAKSDIIP